MCGLVVALSTQSSINVSPDGVRAMANAIQHRGPDASGEKWFDGVGMAHQRLSIMDPNSRPQPLSNERFSLVYNGEIYNHQTLKEELAAKGHQFQTDCDTDVFLAAFTEWGVEAFPRFNGMFAAVIFDHQTKQLIAVRDRFGIKPLYVGDTPTHRLFSSEQQGIEAYDPAHHWGLCEEALDNYMTLGYVIEPLTMKKGIRQLLPGTYEISRLGDPCVSTHTYWSIETPMRTSPILMPEEEERIHIEEAVARQMIADVPVGAFLSGGLDSSTLVAIMQSHVSSPVQCYSAGFENKVYDESSLAKGFAKHVGADFHRMIFDSSLLGKAGEIVDIYGGAFADNAALPTYHLSSLAAQKVKVMLSGDGADELFFGYRNHRSLFVESALKGVIPAWFSKSVLAWLAQVYPNHPSMPRFMRAKSTFKALSMDLSQGYCAAMSISTKEQREYLYSSSFKSRLSGVSTEDRFSTIAAEFEHDDPMKVMQYLDFKTYLPGSVLTKVDRATMRAGVEARVPFLDNDLSSFALSQPSHKNLGFGQHKTQLRQWAAPWLPTSSQNRVKKSFTSPLDSWFRGLQYHAFCRMIASESLLDSGLFDVDRLQQLMDEHYHGKANHGTLMWSLSVLSKAL